MFDANVSSEKCASKFSTIFALVLTVLVVVSFLPISFNPPYNALHVVLIPSNAPPKHISSSKFLSVALDTSLLADGFVNFHMKNGKLRNTMRSLSPGYLRIGGTMADRLIFVRNNTRNVYRNHISEIKISACGYERRACSLKLPNFTFTGGDWLKLYELASVTGFVVLFDLNSLMRNVDGSWNYKNAEELITFSYDHDMDVIWQLGNEPNSYKYVFNQTVTASQLAIDFKKLRQILDKHQPNTKKFMIGPDITNPAPKNTESISYLDRFLTGGGGDEVDAVSFHQYYFNGKTAVADDFVDLKTYDLLIAQIDLVKSLLSYHKLEEKAVWLSETSDGYGGGTPGYSDGYLGTYIWLDKLGVAAKMGIDVVIKQTLFKGFYALIDTNYKPTPNYWISVLYKAFVGPEVVPCIQASSEKVRLYCHCTNKNFKTSSITLFGFNLKDTDAFIRIEGCSRRRRKLGTIYAYILSPFISLFSREIYLNGELLLLGPDGELPPFKPVLVNDDVPVVIPAYCSAFFVIPTDVAACS